MTNTVSATEPEFTPSADVLIERNARYAAAFEGGNVPVAPRRKLAIVACMDSRMDIFKLLGLTDGDAHVVRNGGGVITDDVIRSLCLSQRYMGTREVILIHHTDCGLQGVNEDAFKLELQIELGVKPWWALESFTDPFVDTRQSILRLRMTPFLPYLDNVRGFVFDVDTGKLHEVTAED